MQRPTFFARRAILILVVVFFFVPFALRGARMAVQGMKNDVKDWLPKEFEETKDLEEFRQALRLNQDLGGTEPLALLIQPNNQKTRSSLHRWKRHDCRFKTGLAGEQSQPAAEAR